MIVPPSHSKEKGELVLRLALCDQPENRTANVAVKVKALRSSKRDFHPRGAFVDMIRRIGSAK